MLPAIHHAFNLAGRVQRSLSRGRPQTWATEAPRPGAGEPSKPRAGRGWDPRASTLATAPSRGTRAGHPLSGCRGRVQASCGEGPSFGGPVRRAGSPALCALTSAFVGHAMNMPGSLAGACTGGTSLKEAGSSLPASSLERASASKLATALQCSVWYSKPSIALRRPVLRVALTAEGCSRGQRAPSGAPATHR